MSRENVEAFRELLDAVSRQDLARLTELTHPDVHWRSFFAALLAKGEYHGHDGLREYVADISESWDSLRPEVEDVLDAGDVIVGIGRVEYRGKESGVESTAAAGWMVKFRDGKVIVFRAFNDPGAAFEAVGLGG